MSAIRDKGFAPLVMPSPAVRPLQLYLRRSDDMRLYHTLRPEDSSVPMPRVEGSFSAGLLSGVSSETTDVDFGLSLVSSAVSFITGGTVHIGVRSQSVHKVVYRYTNLDREVAEFLPVRRFVESLKLKDFKEIAEHETYIILETLRAKGIQVSLVDVHGTKVDTGQADVAGLSTSSFSSDNSLMHFHGPTPVTIGYRAVFIAATNKIEMNDLTEAADLPPL